MKKKNQIISIIISAFIVIMMSTNVNAQSKKRMAIISIDSKGMNADNATMTSLVNLEVEKTNMFELMDKYDVADMLSSNNIEHDKCFGLSCLVRVGNLLKADKMMTGSIEKFGNKIILILRIIDVNSGVIETSNVMEYIDQQNELQMMVTISVNNILGIENDQKILDLLVNYQQPITSPKTIVKLNGPRMGASYTFGEYGVRMGAHESEGGYNMYPITSMFGYQWEKQYLSAGDFQALIEVVASVNGMESGKFTPSLLFMNGFRFNKSGWEIGLGPILRLTQTARGFYDSTGVWKLEKHYPLEAHDYRVFDNLDNRGKAKISSGLVFAAGKTFRSGYLNVPVNLFVSPRKDGTVVGLTFGFNIAKTPRNWQ